MSIKKIAKIAVDTIIDSIKKAINEQWTRRNTRIRKLHPDGEYKALQREKPEKRRNG